MCSPENALNGVRVLVVDDEIEICEIMASSISSYGALVSFACNGAEALEKIKNLKPEIVLSDVKMPEMDGFQLLTELNQLQLKVKVFVFVTGSSGYSADEIFAKGAMRLFSKPMDLNFLISELASLYLVHK